MASTVYAGTGDPSGVEGSTRLTATSGSYMQQSMSNLDHARTTGRIGGSARIMS